MKYLIDTLRITFKTSMCYISKQKTMKIEQRKDKCN